MPLASRPVSCAAAAILFRTAAILAATSTKRASYRAAKCPSLPDGTVPPMSDLARLIAVAARLRDDAPPTLAGKGAVLPALLFLTDTQRTPDPLGTIRRLPRDVGVIFR